MSQYLVMFSKYFGSLITYLLKGTTMGKTNAATLTLPTNQGKVACFHACP